MLKFTTMALAAALSITPALANNVLQSNDNAQSSQVQENSSVSQAKPTAQAAKVSFSPLFIRLSDAMSAVKANDNTAAQAVLGELENDFGALNLAQSSEKTAAEDALQAAKNTPNADTLSALSNALFALEKATNPSDDRAERQAFSQQITPAFVQLSTKLSDNAATQQDLRVAFDDFNSIWVKHERVVRNASIAHYGNIETAMALIRVAIESEPVNRTQIDTQLNALQAALNAFENGDTAATTQTATLQHGITLLTQAADAMDAQDISTAQANLTEFIGTWASFEGEVRVRDAALYTQIESQLPVILANAGKAESQQQLKTLIQKINQINPNDRYGIFDAMLILLREGLEALLIITALLAMLKASGHKSGTKWVVGGALAGLAVSVVAAVSLQLLFPSLSGSSRELIEGTVGIVAVVLMLVVGVWLHSKSSAKAWNAYLARRVNQVLSTGSFIGLFSLSFLAVFREGAETILFYAGILPNISTTDFVLGIVLAFAILAAVAAVLFKTSLRLPIPLLFRGLTWLIYLLGFKILGMSLHALQLNGYLPMHIIDAPTISWAGIYPTLLGLGAQLVYVLLIIAISLYQRRALAN